MNFIDSVTGALPSILVGIIILIIAYIIASLVKKFVVNLLKKGNLKDKLVSANADANEANKMVNLLGNIAFLLIFVLFLPAIFSKLGLEAIASPFATATGFILEFLPKLIAAIVILYIGFFVAQIVREVVAALLVKVGVDSFIQKSLNADKQGVKLSDVIANIVYAFIIVPLIIVALDLVGLQVISEPARQIINDFLSYVPKIFVAGLLIAFGLYIARLVSNLVNNALVSLNVDGNYEKLGLKSTVKLSDILAKIVYAILVVIFFVEALNVLNLQILQNIGSTIISYLPALISAAIIMFGAYLLGNFVEHKVVERNSDNKMLGLVSKVVIIAFGLFMTLSQLGFAKNIVEYAFIIVVGALAVAFALSFGLGGREFAKKKLEELDAKKLEDKDNL